MTTKVLWLWKLAIVRFAAYSAVTLIGTYKMCVSQVWWGEMNGAQHLDVILDMASAWLMLFIAFIDKTEKSIESGSDLPPDMTTREETNIKTVKIIPAADSSQPASIVTQTDSSKTVTAIETKI